MEELILIILILIIFVVTQWLKYVGQKDKLHRYYTGTCLPPKVHTHEIVIDGSQFELSEIDLDRILLKRFKYYASLEHNLQLLFLKRLKLFMQKKIFIIKDDEGLKEMPVLVSAAAIALTFGLKDFRLPFYRYIRIYPEEYVAEDSLRILAGNVQQNIITIAWDHLLKGYNDFSDGSNVGLHEMSHALYIQKIVIEKGYANSFLQKYNYLVKECKDAFNMEVDGVKDFYSDYANNNLQEFWAESVELFFEKPSELNNHYPDVYEALKLLLNQDPTNKSNPVLETNLSFDNKLKRIIHFLRIRAVRKKQFS
jgi:MtfA peptidase